MAKTAPQNTDGDAQMRPSTAQIPLRILGTSDLHACLTSWDYFSQKAVADRGLSRIATLIAQARAQCENCLLFDNGDFLAGNGLGDYMAGQNAGHTPHPMVLAMNHLRYDGVNLGNHEFSYGLSFLRSALHMAAFPVVASNFQIDDMPRVARSLMLTRSFVDTGGAQHQINIGVFGVMPSQTLLWEASHLQGKASAHPMLECARTAARDLRSQGADIIIALAHTGLPNNAQDSISEETMAQQIAALPDVDAVIAGHSHKVFPTENSDTDQGNTVLPGFFGSHLGVIDLMLVRSGQAWCAMQPTAQVWATAQRNPDTGTLHSLADEDPAMLDFAKVAHGNILQDLDKVIGTAPQRLHTYFSLVASSDALALIAAVQADALQTALAGGPYAEVPILSAVAPFKAGGRGGAENYTDIPAGQLHMRHAVDLYLHPNTLVGFYITGADLVLWLERAASIFAQIAPHSRDCELINPDFPSFNFDTIFGVSYHIDLTQPAQFDARGTHINPAAQRIVNLRYNGAVVTPDQHFMIASNSYRRDTCIGFLATIMQNIVYENTTSIQTLLRDYVMAQKPFPHTAGAHWGFLPVAGATTILRSGPPAVQVMADISHLRPQALGLDSFGFERFRLHL